MTQGNSQPVEKLLRVVPDGDKGLSVTLTTLRCIPRLRAASASIPACLPKFPQAPRLQILSCCGSVQRAALRVSRNPPTAGHLSAVLLVRRPQ
jgi:hypothetical protein